jgi:hypothetical protein
VSKRSKFLQGSAVGCVCLAGWAAVSGRWRADTSEVATPNGNPRLTYQQIPPLQTTTTLRQEPVTYPTHSIIRPNDLLDNPSSYLDREITVTIVEPLVGPVTVEMLLATDFALPRVLLPDNLDKDLILVPLDFDLASKDRYRKKFASVVKSPMLVQARFESDDALAKDVGHPVYVLRVSLLNPLMTGEPFVLRDLSEIAKGGWDRRFMVYEGIYTYGSEVSSMDNSLEISPHAGMIESGTVPPVSSSGRIVERARVTGFLLAKPGASYGHLGWARAELFATKIEHLGTP